MTPANRPEQEATPQLQADLRNQGAKFAQLYIDRGYINSTLVDDARAADAEVICKPWQIRGGEPDLFKKTDFKLDMRSHTITCPAGQTELFEPGQVVEFDPEGCGSCVLRAQCTHSANGKGRTVSIARDERLQKKLRVPHRCSCRSEHPAAKETVATVLEDIWTPRVVRVKRYMSVRTMNM